MARPKARHALSRWTALRKRVQEATLLFVLADFDGTLVPIRRWPDQARLAPRMRTLLLRLSRLRAVRAGVVSGRGLGELRKLVGVSGLMYVGNHGFEIRGPGIRFVHPVARRSQPALRRIAKQLQAAVHALKGARVEFKRLSVSVHWRNVAARDVPSFCGCVDTALAPWRAQGAVRITRGKRVLEIRPPVDWDKGRAVAMLMERSGSQGGGVVYLGDDRTDEDAFRAVNRLRGVSIFVGRSPAATAARWWLKDPREVERFIRRVIQSR